MTINQTNAPLTDVELNVLEVLRQNNTRIIADQLNNAINTIDTDSIDTLVALHVALTGEPKQNKERRNPPPPYYLEKLVSKGILTLHTADLIVESIMNGRNIFVVGSQGTSTPELMHALIGAGLEKLILVDTAKIATERKPSTRDTVQGYYESTEQLPLDNMKHLKVYYDRLVMTSLTGTKDVEPLEMALQTGRAITIGLQTPLDSSQIAGVEKLMHSLPNKNDHTEAEYFLIHCTKDAVTGEQQISVRDGHKWQQSYY